MNMVSVIVPIFQSEKYLRKCIDSILGQTYFNIEILLIDDGSTDQSPEICDMYKKKDSRVKVIHKNNEGVAKARNTGLDYASGEYILFIDSDDWIEVDMIDRLMEKIKKYQADIVECGYREWKNENCVYKSYENECFVLNKKEDIFYHSFIPEKPYLYKVCWGKLIRRSLCEDIRFPDRTIAEDAAFCNQLLFRCKKVIKIYNPYYNYRIIDGSIMHSEIKSTIFESLDTVIEMYNMLQKDTYTYSKKFWEALDEHISNCATGIADQIIWKGLKLTDIDGFNDYYEKCQLIGKNLSKPTMDYRKFMQDYIKWSRFRREKLFIDRAVLKMKRIISNKRK